MKIDPETLAEQAKTEVKNQLPNGQRVKEVDGVKYVVHEVKETDSLAKLSLIYGVSVRVIKTINGLTSDQIF